MKALDFYIDGLKDKGFSDEKIKELTEHRDLPWLQFAEDYHNKQLLLHNVSQQRELLKAFEEYLNSEEAEYYTGDFRIKEFLEAFNCG
jgi:hypothetical protein